MWSPGETILIRDVWHGHVLTTRSVTVVRDEPTALAVYWAPGSVWQHAIDAAPFRTAAAKAAAVDAILECPPPTLADRTWAESHVLRLSEPGVAHAIWLMWDERWTFECWYINLEAPSQRWDGGVDTCDHVLDIVAWPDGKIRLKDEDQFERCIERGWFTTAQAAEIRAEGERALGCLHRLASSWMEWRPVGRSSPDGVEVRT